MADLTDRELLDRAAKEESIARRMAFILGPSSAAQLALDEAQRSRSAGVPAAVVLHGSTWIVVRAAIPLCGNDAETMRKRMRKRKKKDVENQRLRSWAKGMETPGP